jgi:hypothetical protein
VEVWAVVPNMNAFIRDLTDRGMVGAALARFLRLSPRAMVATGLDALGAWAHWPARTSPRARCGSPDGAGGGFRPSRAARLPPPPAHGDRAGRPGEGLFTEVRAPSARRRTGAGSRNHNPVAAAEVLGAELDAFTAIVAPCNPKGYKMVPDRASSEAVVKCASRPLSGQRHHAGRERSPCGGPRRSARAGGGGCVVGLREIMGGPAPRASPASNAAGPRPRSRAS